MRLIGRKFFGFGGNDLEDDGNQVLAIESNDLAHTSEHVLGIESNDLANDNDQLLGDESVETYVWLLRAWLSCMLGRPPQTVISDRSKALQSAISEVFPRTHHHLFLPLVFQNILEKLGEVGESEVFRTLLARTVYNSLKVDEFERAWEEMIQHFGLKDREWLQSLYDDRDRWAPVYSKDTFLAGLFMFLQGDSMNPFFDGCVQSHTTLKEFFDVYELVLQIKSIRRKLLMTWSQ